MKNWKFIFTALVAYGATTFAFAQEAPVPAEAPALAEAPAPEAPAASAPANMFELKTPYGVVTAEKSIVEGKTTIKIRVSGIHSPSGIYAVMQEVKRVGDSLADDLKVQPSDPNTKRPRGGVQGKHSSVLANKEVSNGKVTISARVYDVKDEILATQLAADFLDVISQMIVEDQISIAGKTLVLIATFVPGADPDIYFSIDIPFVPRETWGGFPNEDVDNTINVDDRNITGI